jgi:hypothetical protein
MHLKENLIKYLFFFFIKIKLFFKLTNIGCQNWALLFDDIENEMSQQDKDQFNSFAHAQVSVTNQLYQYLNKPNIFIFCPTGFSLIFNKFYLQI